MRYLILSLILISLLACSRTTSEKSVTVSGGGGDYSRTEVETTKTTDTSSDCGGVLSCTIDVLGEIIALPFRAVGALAKAIF